MATPAAMAAVPGAAADGDITNSWPGTDDDSTTRGIDDGAPLIALSPAPGPTALVLQRDSNTQTAAGTCPSGATSADTTEGLEEQDRVPGALAATLSPHIQVRALHGHVCPCPSHTPRATHLALLRAPPQRGTTHSRAPPAALPAAPPAQVRGTV